MRPPHIVTCNLKILKNKPKIKINNNTTTERYDYLIKMVFIGDESAGKTCLWNILLGKQFPTDTELTIGVDFGTITQTIDPNLGVTLSGKTLKFQLWDTAGAEKFRTIVSAYYR